MTTQPVTPSAALKPVYLGGPRKTPDGRYLATPHVRPNRRSGPPVREGWTIGDTWTGARTWAPTLEVAGRAIATKYDDEGELQAWAPTVAGLHWQEHTGNVNVGVWLVLGPGSSDDALCYSDAGLPLYPLGLFGAQGEVLPRAQGLAFHLGFPADLPRMPAPAPQHPTLGDLEATR